MTDGRCWRTRRRRNRTHAAHACLQLLAALLLACSAGSTAAQPTGLLLAGGPVGGASLAAARAPTDSRQPSPASPAVSPSATPQALSAAPQPPRPPPTAMTTAAAAPADSPAARVSSAPPPHALQLQPPQLPPPIRLLTTAPSPRALALLTASSVAAAPAPEVRTLSVLLPVVAFAPDRMLVCCYARVRANASGTVRTNPSAVLWL